MSKQCCTCKIQKSVENFNRSKNHPSGLYPVCKECRSIATKEFRSKNRDKLNEKWRDNYKADGSKHRANSARYQKDNWESRKKYSREWGRKNPESCRRHCAARTAQIKKATPPWLSAEQKEAIRWFHDTARDLQWLSESKLSVDHIKPLRGANSCGLHVPWNLQILPLSANVEKSNRLVSA